MFFNSFEFLLFLPLVFLTYWFVLKKSIGLQNALVLVASYLFYGWWDYRFLFLIILSTLIDYIVGLKLVKSQKLAQKKFWLAISIIVNLGLLGIFKYYNFFVDSWMDAWGLLGFKIHSTTLSIILPVGISFYTFQTLSYTIDVYRGKLKPTSSFIAFSAYVAFFPQLVAGPIERATSLLPQFLVKRKFDVREASLGARQILYGFFKKIVIADNVAPYVNDIFANNENYSSPILIIGAILFAIQIYGDFSGYSDIAIGTARLFGFKLMTNFKAPYFSRNIGEFWRRWHISLSTWFRDYVYIPIGGSRGSRLQQFRNVAIIFIVSGFWHGANWTFIFWGALHALFFIPLLFFNQNRKYTGDIASGRLLPSVREGLKIISTFILVCFAWIFFRADSLAHSFEYIAGIFTLENFSNLSFEQAYIADVRPVFCYLVLFFSIEWLSRNRDVFVGRYLEGKTWMRYLVYLVLILSIILSIKNEAQSFIYFQF